MATKNNAPISLQKSIGGQITGLVSANFTSPKTDANGLGSFLVKNQGAGDVTLNVVFADDATNTFIPVVFYAGKWGEEQVKEIQLDAGAGAYNLLWGF